MREELHNQLTQTSEGGTATIAVIIQNGKMLLGLRDYRDGPTVWTAPGGSVDAGETLEEATRREVAEETGVTDLEFIDYIGEVKAEDRDLLYIFYCKTNSNPKHMEPEKFREWVWYPLNDFADGELDNFINEPSRVFIVDYLKRNDIL